MALADIGAGQAAADVQPSAEDRALYQAFREHQAGQFDKAISWYREALRIRPDFPEALNNLGIAFKDLGQFQQAVASYRQALKLRPETAEIWNNLGDALHSLGDGKAAVEHYERAVALREDYGLAWRNLGDARAEQGDAAAAEECYLKAITFSPDLDLSLSPTDLGLREVQSRFAKTVKGLEAADAAVPGFAKAYTDCGAGIAAPVGCRKNVQAVYDFAARQWAGYGGQLSTLLLSLHYQPDATPQSLREAHGEAERFYGRLPKFTAHANDRDPARRLRIGYVSADFRTHSVSYFLTSVFRGHHPVASEIICYSNSTDEDEQTAFFRAHASAWRSVHGMSDERVAELVRRDGIDILVDLSGHTNGNRLGVFARHPALVQVTWLGYPDTTGLTAMDYRLTDSIIDPPGNSDNLSSEALVRLAGGLHCYTGPEGAPAPTSLPAATAGFVTFGSFNNLIKVNGSVLDLWSKLLHRVPQSRLLLKTKWLGLPQMRDRTYKMFEIRGIGRDRVDLMGQQTAIADHLDLYGRIDIGLDTFPYNGATTTCEALWMGVPVVTLAGANHAARVGASLLSRAGLPELVAQSPDDYIAIATNLAVDLDRLATLRADLRRQLIASPVCDEERYALELDSAFRRMWQNWCQSNASG